MNLHWYKWRLDFESGLDIEYKTDATFVIAYLSREAKILGKIAHKF